MHVVVTTDEGEIFNIEIDQDKTLADFCSAIENQLGIPAKSQILYFNGNLMSNTSQTLKQYKLGDGEMVLVRNQQHHQRPSGGEDPAERARQMLLADPERLGQVALDNPRLAEHARNNPEEFRRIFHQAAQMTGGIPPPRASPAGPNASPTSADAMDIEAQKKIEEHIRQQNISKNFNSAMEHHPEVFGRVIMLYIDLEVNGHPVKAFVDSGAQATIMSPQCAEDCNIMRLLDVRFAGIAKGVGSAKILGRVHSAQIKLGNTLLQSSFTVMEGKDVDLLFGLDMLKRHQAVIDLEKNVLRISGEEVRFLPEHELPVKAREMELPPESPQGSNAKGSSSSSSTHGRPSSSGGPVTPKKETMVHGEDKIKILVDLGFPRDKAIKALNACGGNVDNAANLLFSS